jgi:hypothetical protein
LIGTPELAICCAAPATPLPWAMANGMTELSALVIGWPAHHWKPPTAATDTITPVTMSFLISAM